MREHALNIHSIAFRKFHTLVQISEEMGEENKDSLAHSHLAPEIFPKYWQPRF